VQQATRENQLPDPGSEAHAGDSTHRVEGLSPEEQDRIASTLLLETVVIDVDGLIEEVGTTPLKYTKDLGLQLLFDPDCKVFTAGCAYAGSVVAQRKKAAETNEGKN
jgi:hypothetical protein